MVEFQRRLQEIADKQVSGARQADREMLEQIEQTVLLANVVLPVGWLPLGTMAAAERNMLTPLLGLMGMALIGSASLYRAYRTTVRMYQGATTGRKARRNPRSRRRTASGSLLPSACSKQCFPACQSRSPQLRWRAFDPWCERRKPR